MRAFNVFLIAIVAMVSADSCHICLSEFPALGTQLEADLSNFGAVNVVGLEPVALLSSRLHAFCDGMTDGDSNGLESYLCHTGIDEWIRALTSFGLTREVDDEDGEHELGTILQGFQHHDGASHMCHVLSLCKAKSEKNAVPQQVHLSLGDSPDEMRVSWIVLSTASGKGWLRYGTSPDSLDQMHEADYELSWSIGGWKGTAYHCFLRGLERDSTYFYQVEMRAEQSISTPVMHFRSAPELGTQKATKLLLFADQTSDPKPSSMVGTIATLVSEGEVDLIVMAGDLAYANGESSVWDKWGRLVEAYSPYVPLMVVDGNHEDYWNMTNYRGRFALPQYKTPDSVLENGGGSAPYYSFDYNNVHFVCLSFEGNYLSELEQGGAQYDWLQDDLRRASYRRAFTPWIVVVVHRPLYCTYDSERCNEEAQELRAHVEDLLHHYRVDFVFQGHNHMYERNYPVYQSRPEPPSIVVDGVETFVAPKYPVYAIIGTAGKKLSKKVLQRPAWNAAQLSVHGYALVEATADQFRFKFVDEAGETRDAFTIIK